MGELRMTPAGAGHKQPTSVRTHDGGSAETRGPGLLTLIEERFLKHRLLEIQNSKNETVVNTYKCSLDTTVSFVRTGRPILHMYTLCSAQFGGYNSTLGSAV